MYVNVYRLHSSPLSELGVHGAICVNLTQRFVPKRQQDKVMDIALILDTPIKLMEHPQLHLSHQ